MNAIKVSTPGQVQGWAAAGSAVLEQEEPVPYSSAPQPEASTPGQAEGRAAAGSAVLEQEEPVPYGSALQPEASTPGQAEGLAAAGSAVLEQKAPTLQPVYDKPAPPSGLVRGNRGVASRVELQAAASAYSPGPTMPLPLVAHSTTPYGQLVGSPHPTRQAAHDLGTAPALGTLIMPKILVLDKG